uniref:Uncharacterized protein n=1 Tax=Arundo donax TaxID=35708 RepID=A0A0A9CNY8_ARUDO
MMSRQHPVPFWRIVYLEAGMTTKIIRMLVLRKLHLLENLTNTTTVKRDFSFHALKRYCALQQLVEIYRNILILMKSRKLK